MAILTVENLVKNLKIKRNYNSSILSNSTLAVDGLYFYRKYLITNRKNGFSALKKFINFSKINNLKLYWVYDNPKILFRNCEKCIFKSGLEHSNFNIDFLSIYDQSLLNHFADDFKHINNILDENFIKIIYAVDLSITQLVYLKKKNYVENILTDTSAFLYDFTTEIVSSVLDIILHTKSPKIKIIKKNLLISKYIDSNKKFTYICYASGSEFLNPDNKHCSNSIIQKITETYDNNIWLVLKFHCKNNKDIKESTEEDIYCKNSLHFWFYKFINCRITMMNVKIYDFNILKEKIDQNSYKKTTEIRNLNFEDNIPEVFKERILKNRCFFCYKEIYFFNLKPNILSDYNSISKKESIENFFNNNFYPNIKLDFYYQIMLSLVYHIDADKVEKALLLKNSVIRFKKSDMENFIHNEKEIFKIFKIFKSILKKFSILITKVFQQSSCINSDVECCEFFLENGKIKYCFYCISHSFHNININIWSYYQFKWGKKDYCDYLKEVDEYLYLKDMNRKKR